jgi:uncharacterized protein YecE (DUF72 family)
MALHIGTCGWSYGHWTDVLYPYGLPPHQRLRHYVRRFATVELNRSFYGWPGPRSFRFWGLHLPQGFVMAVKAPRELTHGKRLFAPEPWVERIDADLRLLGERCGPLLVQLSPGFACDLPRLDYFLQCLPRDRPAAMEFRHPSWHTDAVLHRLEEKGVAYCVMSGPHLPCVLRATAPFVYVRLHGPDDPGLGGSYSDDNLRWWADRIREWQAQGRDVFAYFNNDGHGHAVRNAERIRQMLADEAAAPTRPSAHRAPP